MEIVFCYCVVEGLLLFISCFKLMGSFLAASFIALTSWIEMYAFKSYYEQNHSDAYKAMLKEKKGLEAQLNFKPSNPDPDLEEHQRRFRFFLKYQRISISLCLILSVVRLAISHHGL